jgi:hypothetical protein
VEEMEAQSEDIQPLSEDQLLPLIQAEWLAIPKDFFLTQPHLMPTRLQMCIALVVLQ